MVICNKSGVVKAITSLPSGLQAALGSVELITAVWTQQDAERTRSINAAIVSALTSNMFHYLLRAHLKTVALCYTVPT